MTSTDQPTPRGRQMDPLPQPTPRPDHRGSSIRTKITMTVAAVAIGIAGGALLTGFGSSQATAEEVRLESTSSAGASPFMSPVGQDQAGLSTPAGVAGEYAGDTAGLYADTGDQPSCEAQSLLANLQADAAKATAWVDALGIRSEDIPSYVASLTPVVLRSDTAVTSHGYQDGAFLAYPAVLQAGTAVLVNSYGEPKVKCFSGNPLTQAVSYPQASYVGPTWGHFAPTSVTVIHRTPTVIKNYTFVNVHKGTTVYRPGKPPQHNDDNWHCKKHPDSDKCKGGTGGNNNSGGNNGTGGGNPGRGPKPDPALEAAAAEAQAKADEAGRVAAPARAVANEKKDAADEAAATATRAQDAAAATLAEADTLDRRAREAKDTALFLAAEAGGDPADGRKAAHAALARSTADDARRVADLKAGEAGKAAKDAVDAKADADTKADQARMAGQAAKDAEAVQVDANDIAKKAREKAGVPAPKVPDQTIDFGQRGHPKDKGPGKDKNTGETSKLGEPSKPAKNGYKGFTGETGTDEKGGTNPGEVNPGDTNNEVPLGCKGVKGPAAGDSRCNLPGNESAMKETEQNKGQAPAEQVVPKPQLNQPGPKLNQQTPPKVNQQVPADQAPAQQAPPKQSKQKTRTNDNAHAGGDEGEN